VLNISWPPSMKPWKIRHFCNAEASGQAPCHSRNVMTSADIWRVDQCPDIELPMYLNENELLLLVAGTFTIHKRHISELPGIATEYRSFVADGSVRCPPPVCAENAGGRCQHGSDLRAPDVTDEVRCGLLTVDSSSTTGETIPPNAEQQQTQTQSERGFPSSIRRRSPASQPRMPARKSSNGVLSSRLIRNAKSRRWLRKRLATGFELFRIAGTR
jgi:hypothetical protein